MIVKVYLGKKIVANKKEILTAIVYGPTPKRILAF